MRSACCLQDARREAAQEYFHAQCSVAVAGPGAAAGTQLGVGGNAFADKGAQLQTRRLQRLYNNFANKAVAEVQQPADTVDDVLPDKLGTGAHHQDQQQQQQKEVARTSAAAAPTASLQQRQVAPGAGAAAALASPAVLQQQQTACSMTPARQQLSAVSEAALALLGHDTPASGKGPAASSATSTGQGLQGQQQQQQQQVVTATTVAASVRYNSSPAPGTTVGAAVVSVRGGDSSRVILAAADVNVTDVHMSAPDQHVGDETATTPAAAERPQTAAAALNVGQCTSPAVSTQPAPLKASNLASHFKQSVQPQAAAGKGVQPPENCADTVAPTGAVAPAGRSAPVLPRTGVQDLPAGADIVAQTVAGSAAAAVAVAGPGDMVHDAQDTVMSVGRHLLKLFDDVAAYTGDVLGGNAKGLKRPNAEQEEVDQQHASTRPHKQQKLAEGGAAVSEDTAAAAAVSTTIPRRTKDTVRTMLTSAASPGPAIGLQRASQSSRYTQSEQQQQQQQQEPETSTKQQAETTTSTLVPPLPPIHQNIGVCQAGPTAAHTEPNGASSSSIRRRLVSNKSPLSAQKQQQAAVPIITSTSTSTESREQPVPSRAPVVPRRRSSVAPQPPSEKIDFINLVSDEE